MALAEAQRTNADGVALAATAGLPAEPMCTAQTSTVWATIIAAADEVDADLIVTGTRAITGFRALVQSSVADHVRRRGHRPVLIVPRSFESPVLVCGPWIGSSYLRRPASSSACCWARRPCSGSR